MSKLNASNVNVRSARSGSAIGPLIRRLYSPDDRSTQSVPAPPFDTKAVPLEMTVKGFLADAAEIGDEVEIVTPAGRRLRGVLRAVNPAYDHGFGPPLEELSPIGEELRAILEGKSR